MACSIPHSRRRRFATGCGRVRRIKIMGAARVEIQDEDVGACWPALDDMSGAEEAMSSFDAGKAMNPELYPQGAS